MDRKKSIAKNQIIGGFVLILFLSLVFTIVYKAQLVDSFDKKVYCTLMWEHKQNNAVELSADKSSLTQVFTCTVPNLKMLIIECKGKEIDDNTYIELSLTEPGSGKEYYHKKAKLCSVVKNGKKKIKMKMRKSIRNSENKQFILNVSLIDAAESKVSITANYKAGIVTSFDGVQDNKTNIIYSMQYSNTKQLKKLYSMVCVGLLLLVALSYYLIIVRKKTVVQFYLPLALLMGFVFQSVVVVHGVPDEPWHMDTAYKLSNNLLFVDDVDEPGYLMKRQCDVVMSDMLANGVESNSYYQLLNHTFEIPENKRLVKVAYTDSSNIVPDYIFLPTAIGISVGRLLGLSAMLTLQLGRMCNLVAFVLLTWLAIRKIPYGKNVLGAIGMLPIALQQGASASYDAMINGIIFLFIATCLQLLEKQRYKKKDIVLIFVLIVLIAMVKGGVYLPIVLLIMLVLGKFNIVARIKSIDKKWIISSIGLIILLIIAMAWKFLPIASAIMVREVNDADKNALYSLMYLLERPLNGVYLYWNTFLESGAGHLSGMLGGKLGWHDIQMSWIFIAINLISLLLLVNVEQDQYIGDIKRRISILAICAVSIFLIMLSMLFACTTLSDSRIVGLQGRYYLPMAPLLFMITSNSMIKVRKIQSEVIWMTYILVGIMIVVQFVVNVL